MNKNYQSSFTKHCWWLEWGSMEHNYTTCCSPDFPGWTKLTLAVSLNCWLSRRDFIATTRKSVMSLPESPRKMIKLSSCWQDLKKPKWTSISITSLCCLSWFHSVLSVQVKELFLQSTILAFLVPSTTMSSYSNGKMADSNPDSEKPQSITESEPMSFSTPAVENDTASLPSEFTWDYTFLMMDKSLRKTPDFEQPLLYRAHLLFYSLQ